MDRPKEENSPQHIEPTPAPAPAPGIPDVPEQKFAPESHGQAVSEADKTALPREIPRGESQWGIIWRQFRKRKLAVFSAGVIWLLITVAIWAPFIANDRPLMYIGYNRQEYQESARTARIMLNLFIDQKWKTAEEPWTEWRLTQVEIMSLQLDLMAGQLAPLEREQLDVFRKTFYDVVGVDNPDQLPVETLRELRSDLRRQFDSRAVSFQYRQYWPVLQSLSSVEVAFLLWNLSVLLAPIWSRLYRLIFLRGERRGTPMSVRMAIIAGLPIVAAVIWHFAIPDRLDRTNYKVAVMTDQPEQAQDALVVFEGVLWPPISYGLDEDHLRRKYARPFLMAEDNAFTDAGAPKPAADASEPLGRWDTPHWLGTDDIGRDVLTRMIWGGRVSLTVGIVAVSIYVTIGIIVGALAGYFRGAWDMIISRVIEVVICFPSFFLILSIVAFLGPNIFNIMIVIGVTGWTGIARLVRAEFLRLAEQEFVLAGRALGYSPWRIIFKHVLPNAMAPVLVSATFGVAGAILTESALSFLGFGITVPTPSWGGILSSGREAIFRAPWLIYFPGTAIFITITAYNLVGEALRDAADPRLRN